MSDQQQQNVVTVKQNNLVGILAIVFAILSVFLYTPYFLPVALILSIAALIKKQFLLAGLALVICVFAVYSSPSMRFMIYRLLEQNS